LAWSFLTYVINADGGKSRDAFARFLRAMNGTGTKAVSEVFEETTKLKLKTIQRGWRDQVLAWKKPAEPLWASLVVEGEDGPDPGIRAGDRAWSVEGVEVSDAAAFN